jgi:hypothetical protein
MRSYVIRLADRHIADARLYASYAYRRVSACGDRKNKSLLNNDTGGVTQVFTWSHVVHVDSFGLLGTSSQHHAFRSIAEGKVITSSGDMGRLVSITCDKVQREAGLPVTHLTANTLRHMYVVWARTPGQQFTAAAEAGAQVCILAYGGL